MCVKTLCRMGLLGLTSLIGSSASATTYFVAPTVVASDSNPGSVSAPLATLQAACKVAQPGDTIYLSSGTYTLTNGQWVMCSGTSTAPITISSAPGSLATIDATNIPIGTDGIWITGSYVNVVRVDVKNSPGAGIAIAGGSYDSITGCHVYNSFKSGIKATAGTLGGVDHITISNNTVYNNSLENSPTGVVGAAWDPAIHLVGATNTTISSNYVYANFGEGITSTRSDSCLVTKNQIWDSFSVNLYLNNTTNSTFSQNYIFCTSSGTQFYRNGLPAAGIQVANEAASGAIPNPSANCLIAANIVKNCGGGFSYNSYGLGGGLRNFTVVNNTFFRTLGCLFFVAQDAGTTNTIFANNIFRQAGTASMVYMPSAAGITFSSNCWFGAWISPSVKAAGDIYADPGWVNPSPTTPSLYNLSPASPCIGAATNIFLGFDYFGNLSSPNHDIGAVSTTSHGP